MNAHSKIAIRRQTNLEDLPTIFVELNILSSTEDRCPFGLLSVPGHYYFHQYCAVLLQEGQVTGPVSLYSWKKANSYIFYQDRHVKPLILSG